MTNTLPTRPAVPIPTSVSEQAQSFLATPYVEREERPALDDTKAWIRQIEDTDRMLLERFGAHELPVDVEDGEIAGVHTFVIRAKGVSAASEAPIYLDIHGGALVMGGGDVCRLMGSATALTNGMTTWAVDYRMAPLHPYPAALDDCVAVYRTLLQDRSPQSVFVGGGSAGGNLAAALLLRAKDEGLPMPAGLVLISPEVDLTESGDSFRVNLGVDNVLTTSLMQTNLLYAAGHDLSHPYLSPLFGDVTGFPPTFVQAGTRDLFLSNAVRMHRKLRAAGVDAELHVFEAMPHGGFGGAPEDLEMRLEIRNFLDRVQRG